MPVIFDIKRFALHDGPGIRTTVFFKGCPLNCLWCHNPESQSAEPEEYTINRLIDGKDVALARIYGKEIHHDALMSELLKDKVFYEESGGGVTISGGEPLLQFDELVKLLKTLGKKGIHRAVDTSGQAPKERILKVAEHTDLFLYDLKAMDQELHKKYTGVSNKRILENADTLLDAGARIIFRVPVIPGINDTDKELTSLMNYIVKRNERIEALHLLPYHKIGSDKYRRLQKDFSFGDINEPSDHSMKELKFKMESCGVDVVIGG